LFFRRKGYGRHAEREKTGDGSSKGAGSKRGIEGNYAAMLNISQAKQRKKERKPGMQGTGE